MHLPCVVLEVPILESLHLLQKRPVEPIEWGVVALADLGRLLKMPFLEIDEAVHGRIVYLLLSGHLLVFLSDGLQATQRHEPPSPELVRFLHRRGL